ncbi:DUF1841 family protein [Denitromonas ohlonensis]|jgi:hypothetical protein|uniref:DUF1841 family protein n=2 Tax=Denitromonas TaxID=139331 RepID=A0A557RVP7_9RHOO|nr:DUF1841 family protein [Denitromonas ohlonensis]TVO69226.1 DUF1841 family protein [Denitromonas ohlonensis]TVO77326.1 DUF1841 family protein [Denitromonas ohlonensis]TVT78051.1 MAG: DUF1841 family protein [Denitromonas halophila]
MFDPSRDQARQFFIEAWRKQRDGNILTPLESMVVDIVQLHPEYQPLLEDPDAIDHDFSPEDGQVNPFLHLSLHLAIEEQLSINQPPGLKPAFAQLQLRKGDRHDALHEVLECLGEVIWKAQRDRQPPDGAAYVEAVRKRAGLA